jgi:hypothetical protein
MRVNEILRYKQDEKVKSCFKSRNNNEQEQMENTIQVHWEGF